MNEVSEHIVNSYSTKELNQEELILMRVKLFAKRRITWLRKIWSETPTNEKSDFNAHDEVDGYLSNRDNLSDEKYWYNQNKEAQDITYSIQNIEKHISDNPGLRINILAQTFGLHQIEIDILQTCLAIKIDPNLSRVFAYLQDHSGRGYVTESLVERLLQHRKPINLSANSYLYFWGLVHKVESMNGEPSRLECDPYIKRWLLGSNEIDDTLISCSHIVPVKEKLECWQIDSVVNDITKIINSNLSENKLRVFIEGPVASGRKSFAAIICDKLGFPLLAIDTNSIRENDWQKTYIQAQRQAILSNISILWQGEKINELTWNEHITSINLQFVIGESKHVLKSSNAFIDLRVTLPSISIEEKLRLWKRYVPSSKEWKTEDLNEIVERYNCTIGQIVSLGKKLPITPESAYKALKEDSGRSLGKLAQHMPSTFSIQDLVLPEYTQKAIDDFIFEATERATFWEQPHAKRLYPQGRGLIGLFTGSPGTGKTMAAQIIASKLKLDLFRINLSTVVSKYVGESSKNIEKILSTAKNLNVILLFDEADSLFGKRTEIKDAHDRFANTDTNYLLQAIENYSGIVILASNKKSNIDAGFTRRLRYVLDFPKPDSAQRFTIWKKVIGELSGEKTLVELKQDLEMLSAGIDITGAQIKQAVLSALFISRKKKENLNIYHILAGLEREVAKEGRGLGKDLHKNFNTSKFDS